MIVEEIRRAKIIAILRGDQPGRAVPVAQTLIEAGITWLEVTLSTPDALTAITKLRDSAGPGVRIGAGTVITTAEAKAAIAAGAEFLVTPTVTESVAAGAAADIPVFAGAYTATEAVTAMSLGATAVKLFPAGVSGASYLKALRDPLPHIPFLAVGGIGLAEMPAFHAAGAIGFGIGGPLVGDAMRGGALTDLAARGRAFVQAVTEL